MLGPQALQQADVVNIRSLASSVGYTRHQLEDLGKPVLSSTSPALIKPRYMCTASLNLEA